VADIKAALARLGLGAKPPQPEPESEIEYLAWFRFPVTWSYVNGLAPTVAPKPTLASSALTLAPAVSSAPSQEPAAPAATGIGDGSRPIGAVARWEMVVPKMVRPPAKPVANLTAAAPAPNSVSSAAAAPAPAPVRSPVAAVPPPPVTKTVPVPFAPSFSLHTSDDRLLARYWLHIVLAAIMIVAVGCLLWGLSGSSPAARTSGGHQPGVQALSFTSIKPGVPRTAEASLP